MTSAAPGDDVEYTYSTPGIDWNALSSGATRRRSTSTGLRPGAEANTSIIGTLICGSSSRGSRTKRAWGTRAIRDGMTLSSGGLISSSAKLTAVTGASMRSTWSGGMASTEKPGGARSPFTSTWV